MREIKFRIEKIIYSVNNNNNNNNCKKKKYEFLSNLNCLSNIFYEFSKQTNISSWRNIKYDHLYPYIHSHMHVHIFSQTSIMSARLIRDWSCFIQTTCCRLVPTSSEKSTTRSLLFSNRSGSCSTLRHRVLR